jgi:hypothetical protein
MANKPKLTEEVKAQVVELLMSFPNLTEVSKLVGLSPQTIYNHRKKDEEFASQVEEALEIGYDTMEGEAYRRAVEGWDEPVFFQGIPVGSVRKYSDGLLKFLLKGYRRKRFNPGIKLPGSKNERLTLTLNVEGDND